MPASYILHAVVRAVSEVFPPENTRVLDVSCGEGDVMAALAERGYAVEGTHYRADDYILRNPNEYLRRATIHDGIDLGKPLPFADQSYDVVLATEVIEHLADHPAFLRETARILKPGGALVLSTPNVHRLKSRWTFFWTGRHDLLGGRLGWETPAGELYSTHHHPVDFSILHSLLHQQGLRVEKLGFTRSNPGSWALLPLFPVIHLCARLATRRVVRDHPEGGRDLRRWLTHPRLLLSDQLLVVARKEAD